VMVAADRTSGQEREGRHDVLCRAARSAFIGRIAYA
jgi:hypothetical protein